MTGPGGRIAIIDLTAPDDAAEAAEAAEADRIERLRDPSHGRTLTLDEIHGLLEAAGAVVVSTSRHDHALDVEDWMERTATPRAVRTHIRQRFEQERAGGPPAGLRPHRSDTDAALHLTHTWTMTVANRAR